MTESAEALRQRAIEAATRKPFSFEQGGSLHVGVLGLVARPSGPHDDEAFVSGVWDGRRSQADLDLTSMHDDPGEFVPQLDLWFDGDQTLFDISEAFVGMPQDALAESGIPPAVLDGPVAVTRAGDAGDGVVALLTQMCAGKLIIPPAAMAQLIASPDLVGFGEHEVEGIEPARAFNAVMPMARFLADVGLSSTTIINQIAVLGCDLRLQIGPDVTELLDAFIVEASAHLAWFLDADGRIQTSQVVLRLDDFLDRLFRDDTIVERLAEAEETTTTEIESIVNKASELGRLAYMNVMWQTYTFDDEVDPVEWPDAVDLSDQVADQATRLRDGAEADVASSDP